MLIRFQENIYPRTEKPQAKFMRKRLLLDSKIVNIFKFIHFDMKICDI